MAEVKVTAETEADTRRVELEGDTTRRTSTSRDGTLEERVDQLENALKGLTRGVIMALAGLAIVIGQKAEKHHGHGNSFSDDGPSRWEFDQTVDEVRRLHLLHEPRPPHVEAQR